MRSAATNIEDYIKSLPDDRREAVSSLREVVLRNLPEGYVETMDWGMICYEIPLERYPNTYNKKPLMYAAIASQKNHMAIYLTAPYVINGGEVAFRQAWAKSGKKLDMGKSCVRFRKLDDLAMDVIAESISSTSPDEYIRNYEESRGMK